jgi:DNA ligase 1
MPDLSDGESTEMKGSGAKPYTLKNTGGVYSCNCPAWRNQSVGIERRTCKHLRKLRGDAAEEARLGGAILPAIRSAGEVKEGPPLLLAERYEPSVNIKGWWMSEKLDGVRAYWDGKQLLSRLGNAFYVPDWFMEKFPDFPVDGELFGGRKKFQRTVSIVRRQDKNELWKEITFLLFDAPAEKGPFEERQKKCQDYVEQQKPPYVKWHEHQRCKDALHLKEMMDQMETLGGEGMMLRQPGSIYVAGRSSTLLKVKNFFDAEARVLDHLPGEGKHKGRLGALLVEMPNKTRFEVGTGFSDAERESPPPFGSIITYRYQELSDGGVPRFPSYIGIRDDIVFTGKEDDTALIPSKKEVETIVSNEPIKDQETRYYTLIEGSSEKFWEIKVEGKQQTVRYGRVGANGQSKTKTFPSAEAAQKAAGLLIDEKQSKGYRPSKL